MLDTINYRRSRVSPPYCTVMCMAEKTDEYSRYNSLAVSVGTTNRTREEVSTGQASIDRRMDPGTADGYKRFIYSTCVLIPTL